MKAFGIIIAIVTGIMLVIVLCFIQPYMEMKAFNKFSHTKANMADAIFSNLRIMAD